MTPDTTIPVKTGKVPVVWGNLARIRYSSLPKEVREAPGLVPFAAMLWCAIAAKPNPYPTWEHLADEMDVDNLSAYDAALAAILPSTPEVEKKSPSSDSVPSPGLS